MRLGFYVIVCSLVLADVLAWVLASAWLRRHGARPAVRYSNHVFFSLQTAYALALVVLVTVGFAGARRYLEWIPTPVQALIYVWHMVFLPLSIVGWIIVGLIVAGRRIARLRPWARPNEEPAPVIEAQMSRRAVLLASVAAIPPLLTVGATGYGLSQTWRFTTRKLTLQIPGLPPALEGFRIAHVSDLHVGRWSTPEFLSRVVEATNALDSDVILFTGDLLDVSVEDLPQGIETLRRMRARQGLYLVEGNHDLMDNALRFRRGLISERLNFLRGESAFIEHNGAAIQLLGLPWARGEEAMRSDVAAIARQRQSGAFPILLAHHPHAFDAAAAEGLPLVLAGHTHGGQIAVSREFNAGSMMFRYISGVYRQGSSTLLVSNGTGNWFPLRVNAPAEIIDVTLRPA